VGGCRSRGNGINSTTHQLLRPSPLHRRLDERELELLLDLPLGARLRPDQSATNAQTAAEHRQTNQTRESQKSKSSRVMRSNQNACWTAAQLQLSTRYRAIAER
jgi:hypothetical protein